MIELGSKVKDTLSGFIGVATARTEYLYDTPSVRVEPCIVGDDGKLLPSEWIVEPRLVVLESPKPKIGFQG